MIAPQVTHTLPILSATRVDWETVSHGSQPAGKVDSVRAALRRLNISYAPANSCLRVLSVLKDLKPQTSDLRTQFEQLLRRDSHHHRHQWGTGLFTSLLPTYSNLENT